MGDCEYHTMAEVEESHWWYLGLRDLLGRILKQYLEPRIESLNILDVGCGTGANLRFIEEHFPDAQLTGFDLSSLAIELARKKVPQATLYVSDLRDPSLPNTWCDAIVSCDALYVPGIQASKKGLEAIVGQLKHRGLLFLHLPAYQWLYSEHDQAVGTTERYTLHQVRTLCQSLGLHCEHISYRLCHLLPIVILKRSPQWLTKRKLANPKSELARVPNWINRRLYQTLCWENRLIASGVKLPFGSSIFAVARKVDA